MEKKVAKKILPAVGVVFLFAACPETTEASFLEGLLHSAAGNAAAADNERAAQVNEAYAAARAAEPRMMPPKAVYEQSRPMAPEIPGDWVEDPYVMYGEYYPGYPGQSCFYKPAEEAKGALSVSARQLNFGKHKAGFGRPVYYPGDTLPAEWITPKAEQLADWAERPHSALECKKATAEERAGHTHLADGQYVRLGADGNYEVITGAPDYGWLGDKKLDAAKAMARMGDLTDALVLMGDATVRLGDSLGRDTTDVLAAVNLVRQQPTQAGLSNLTGEISNFKYSSEEFEAAYNSSEERRTELKEAMEYAEKAKHASNRLLAKAGLKTAMNVFQSIMAIGSALQGGGLGGLQSAFSVGMNMRDELMGASDMAKCLKKAYKEYTEQARAVKALLNPAEVKEDSEEVKEMMAHARDGGLKF